MGKTFRKDGWKNLVAGIGSVVAKSNKTTPTSLGEIDAGTLEIMYTNNGLARRVVELFPDSMFRQGWQFVFEEKYENEKELIQRYIDVFDELKVVTQLNEAYKMARLYGGALAIIGAIDGKDLSTPLNAKSIKEWDEIRVIPRISINHSKMIWQEDPMKKRYGKPETYSVQFKQRNGTQLDIDVHYTRVIEIKESPMPNNSKSKTNEAQAYWGQSTLQLAYEQLRDVGGAMSSMANLMYEMSIGKFKLHDLDAILSNPDAAKVVQNRLEAMDATKSSIRSIFLDKDEDFVRESVQFGGVDAIIYQFFMMLCAATGYPMTLFFGIAPGGLNSTGQGDQSNFYDVVKSRQETELAPNLRRIVHLIAQQYGIPEPNIVFNTLYQMSETEKVDIQLKTAQAQAMQAQAYRQYMEMGVLTADDVARLQFGEEVTESQSELVLPPVGEN